MAKHRAPRGAVRGPACWFLGFVLLSCVPARVDAADSFWRNPAGGTFSSGSNWSGGVPGAGDNAFFGLSTPGPLGNLPLYTVSFTALASNSSLRIVDDSVVFDLNGLVYETINTSFGMVLGSALGKTGQLTVLDGIVTVPFQSDLEIAAIAGGSGGLSVGAGGKVIGTMDVLVGLNGAGVLSIFNNGDVIANDVTIGKNAGSSGTATIFGGGSSLLAAQLTVGASGVGSLNITAAGRIDSTSGKIASSSGITGTATIDGANSKWVNSDSLVVGDLGTGTMNITAGGLVQDTSGAVGHDGNGTALVDGVNSRWINSSGLGVGTGNTGTGLLEVANGGRVQTGFMGMGIFGDGTLTITSGGRVDSSGTSLLGCEPGSSGTATIDGANSTWVNTGSLNVGILGEGTLNITAGGLLQNTSAVVGSDVHGTVHVDGVNSQWINSSSVSIGTGNTATGLLEVANGGRVQTGVMRIAIFGDGTLTITSGGRVDSSGTSLLGCEPGSSGTATIDGANSTWVNTGSLNVGEFGEGTLNITAGGLVQTTSAIVGSDGHGTVHVDGVNSRWINSGRITVGVDNTATGLLEVTNGAHVQAGQMSMGIFGDATLRITSGGRVDSSGTSLLGCEPGSSGTATVAGAGSTWMVSGDLRVGSDGVINAGVGTLRIQSGGTVDVAGKTTLAQGDLVALEGGTFNTSEIDFLQGLGTFQWTSGTLRLVHYDGNLLVPNGGVFAPGVVNVFSPSINVAGIYTQQAGATLEIDFIPVAGIVRSDAVVVSDSAVVGGTLALKRVNGAVPDPTTSYIIFDAGSIGGSFANVANGQRLTTVDGFGSFVVNYGAGSPFDPTQIVLSSFLASLPGDYNSNGVVDAADYVLWRNGGPLANEVDTPGVVNAADYAAWRARFGNTSGSGAGTSAHAAVPEPASTVLLLIGLVCVAVCRRSTA